MAEKFKVTRQSLPTIPSVSPSDKGRRSDQFVTSFKMTADARLYASHTFIGPVFIRSRADVSSVIEIVWQIRGGRNVKLFKFLKTGQRVWLKSRDLHCVFDTCREMKYPRQQREVG